jgi:hypothetical protein
MPLGFITAFLNQATAQGSRSTVLRPVTWFSGVLLFGLLACFELKAPEWASKTLAAMLFVTFLLFLGAYLFCLVKDRDALRSETYSIQRLAIEKGYIGDNIAGLFDPKTGETTKDDASGGAL